MALCACGMCGLQVPAGSRFLRGHNRKMRPRYEVRDMGHSTPCWVWTGHTLANGYGQYKDRGRVFQAHRWSYEQRYGPVPQGLEIDHLCSVKPCINPEHLEAVTHLENVRRSRVCKLTAAQVADIRFQAACTDLDPVAFSARAAAIYSLKRDYVGELLRGVQWPDVLPARMPDSPLALAAAA